MPFGHAAGVQLAYRPAIYEPAIQEPSASSIGPCAMRDRQCSARRAPPGVLFPYFPSGKG
jgi:hypothetical protein